MIKTSSEEFMFLAQRLDKIARLLVDGNTGNITEAAFLIGCLHSICIQDSIEFQEKK